MNSFGFDFNEYAQDNGPSGGDYTPVPPGQYNLLIDSAEVKQTKAGDDMLKLTFRIEDGDYAGRLIFESLVYGHPSEKVQQIARSKMAAIGRVMGKEPQTADDFVGTTLVGKIGISPARGEYGPSNRLDRVVEGAAKAAAPSAPAQGGSSNATPW